MKLHYKICLQLISNVGWVFAQEERGDRTDGSEAGHRNWQVSMFITVGKLISYELSKGDVCVSYAQNNKLHGGTDEAHLGNRAEEDWFQAWGWK